MQHTDTGPRNDEFALANLDQCRVMGGIGMMGRRWEGGILEQWEGRQQAGLAGWEGSRARNWDSYKILTLFPDSLKQSWAAWICRQTGLPIPAQVKIALGLC